MQTTQTMMKAGFPKSLSSIHFTHYCNVYQDKDGETHYSTEELAVDETGIHSFDDALEEAFQLTIKKTDWEYISTMTDGMPVTKRMQACLRELHGFADRVRSYGASLDGITSYEFPEYLDRVIEDSTQFGMGT